MNSNVENAPIIEDVGHIKPKFDLANKINDSIQSLIAFADQKANFIITVNLGLLAGNFALLSTNYPSLKNILKDHSFNGGLILAVYLIFIITILIFQWLSFSKAISVVKPNMNNASKKTSIFYFTEIASSNHDDFLLKFINKEDKDFLDELVYQIYDKGCICKNKFALVGDSIAFLKINLFLTILHPFINLFINLNY
jgi:Family of unknown function (DUF5706)